MKTHTTKIGGTEYTCEMLPGWDGCGLFFDLVKQVGEPAMVMVTRAFAEDDLEDLDVGEVVGAGAYTLFARLSREQGLSVMKQIFSVVRRVEGDRFFDLGNEIEFNTHFSGETLRAMQVFAWALQKNFQSFLDGSRLLGAYAAAKSVMGKSKARAETTRETEAQDSTTPQTSPPSSGSSPSMPTEATI